MRLLGALAALPAALAAHHRGEGAQAKRKWHDASFFDSFQTGESTWDYDAAQIVRAEDNPSHNYADGWNPDVTNPFDPKEVDPLAFSTLPSNGQGGALQTLPEPKTGPYGHDQAMGSWYKDSGGKTIQSYVYPTQNAEQAEQMKAVDGDVLHLLKGSGKKQANWFDASVSQYDAYGRAKNPFPGNPSILVSQGYESKAANVSLTCKSAGCNASATLSLGQADGAVLANCRLSVQVKPTDFGGEKVVEFITVNDRPVSLNCAPRSAVKCDQASDLSELYTCVNSVDVQHLWDSSGALAIAAKISDQVNRSECAYQGNMLYAVPQLACLVGTSSKTAAKARLAQEPERGLRGSRGPIGA